MKTSERILTYLRSFGIRDFWTSAWEIEDALGIPMRRAAAGLRALERRGILENVHRGTTGDTPRWASVWWAGPRWTP